jgi:hypothetical protein
MFTRVTCPAVLLLEGDGVAGRDVERAEIRGALAYLNALGNRGELDQRNGADDESAYDRSHPLPL